MSRTPKFDEWQVLHAAMQQFWRYGYSGTSVQDLVHATGINRASMYGAFGDKRSLFLKCIEHYITQASAEQLSILDSTDPALNVIQAFFDHLIQFSVKDQHHLGCLLTNSALEVAPHDPEVHECLQKRLQGLENAFQQLLQRGQSEGDISRQRDPRQLARFLVSSIQGIRVMARIESKPQILKDIQQAILENLAG